MSQTFVERRWSSADGLSLAARDYAAASGTAKLPVIAIHGLTRNSADFDAIAPLIAQSGRRVLAVDIRGRGQSDRAPDPMTYQPVTYAQDVLALMRDLGIERAVWQHVEQGDEHGSDGKKLGGCMQHEDGQGHVEFDAL